MVHISALVHIVKCACRATEGGGTAAFGLTAAQAGAMGVPATAPAGPVTSTSGATRILLLVNCVNREELLDDECAPSHVLPLLYGTLLPH